ncbi:hypothetical protein GF386_03340 [Candidatus Pacearchaeota archaeon]|nr:hypothetical protein [Candidatus Pacearchaeota archaeon]MBD3283174.1 hypothetical protein [Candidatus Pacearchaeota archaeon]
MKKSVIFLFLLLLIPNITAVRVITGDIITGDTVTGKATNQPTDVSIWVTAIPPDLNITSPKNQTYIDNESLLINYTSDHSVSEWYSLDGSNNISLIGSVFFNTTSGSHILYLYANNSDGIESQENVSFFINLTKFIIYYDEYRGVYRGGSTDFYKHSYIELQNLSKVVLENTNYGKILFNNAVNLTDDRVFDNILNLDNNTHISLNRIELDSSELPNFNQQATLWLYNLSFSNPRILRNGDICPSNICVKESYSNGILRFNVTGFSVYSAEETPSGDTGGGGGVAGEVVITPTAIYRIIYQFYPFKLDKGFLIIKLREGESLNEFISIENPGNYSLDIEVKCPNIESFASIDQEFFKLNSDENKVVKMNISAIDRNVGSYSGKIIINGTRIFESVPVIIEVMPKKSYLDILFNMEEEIPKDKLLEFTLDLSDKEGVPLMDIIFNYSIIDKDGRVIFSEEEDFVIDKKLTIGRKIRLPRDTALGDYYFYGKLNYRNLTDLVSSQFRVVEFEKPFLSRTLWSIELFYLILVPSLLLIAILLYLINKFSRDRNSGK